MHLHSSAPAFAGSDANRHGSRDFSRVDEARMDEALALAVMGRPSPRPRMGVVVVLNEQVVATAFASSGAPHPVVAALAAAGERARGATLYSTLEPCNEFGVAEPVSAILQAGVTRVVLGALESRLQLTSGAARLSAAAVEVTVGIRAEAAQGINAAFDKATRQGAPLVTMTMQQGEAAADLHAELRRENDAVLLGLDAASLASTEVSTRVLVDTWLDAPSYTAVMKTAAATRTIVFHGTSADPERHARLVERGVELVALPHVAEGRVSMRMALRRLPAMGVHSLLVLGDEKLRAELQQDGLVDQVVEAAPTSRIVCTSPSDESESAPVTQGRNVA